MYEISTEGVPIKVWGREVDAATLEQARRLAELPFAFRWVCLMPDAHVGYGMPIGGVLAADGAVVPHAVGLDIGCGVRAWDTGLEAEEFLRARDIVMSGVQRNVPAGREWHKSPHPAWSELAESAPGVPALHAEFERASKQLATLGSGNHFYEAQRDEAGSVWMMVHSGSRNLGKRMADRYDAIAKDYARKTRSPIPPEWGLAHLPADSREGREYLAVMDFCLRFANANRREMAAVAHSELARRFPAYEPGDEIDVHHNYASMESHFDREVLVHRKGAVRARGTVLIPGSMGTSSYVGRGLANPESFESCSHGAGRRMGRREAKRTIPVEDVVVGLREQDVRLFKARRSDLAEEAPLAYKDIEDVMRLQADLVEPMMKLTPLGVMKG